MKVIFVKDLKKQGKRGEIKEFKDGYANNFLIKKGYAKRLTDDSLSEYNRKLNEEKQMDSLNKKDAIMLKEQLEKEELVFKVKTGVGDRVFGSISSKQIKDVLKNRGFNIDKKDIKLDYSLSTLGYHDVLINLYKDINCVIKVKLEK